MIRYKPGPGVHASFPTPQDPRDAAREMLKLPIPLGGFTPEECQVLASAHLRATPYRSQEAAAGALAVMARLYRVKSLDPSMTDLAVSRELARSLHQDPIPDVVVHVSHDDVLGTLLDLEIQVPGALRLCQIRITPR